MSDSREQFAGLLLGSALGDSLGLPYEGLSRRRVRRWLGPRALQQKFLFGRGLGSDDTDHQVFVAQSLLVSRDPARFARALAWRLRLWLLSLPAGIGLATLRSCVRLWLGWSPAHSGVVSAGNGAAMRSALIGAVCSDQAELRLQLVKASTGVTHRDPQALAGATAVAEIAARLREGLVPDEFEGLQDLLSRLSDDPGWQAAITRLGLAVHSNETLDDYLQRFCGPEGVSGYVLQTVPVALLIWWRHRRNFRAAITAAVGCGGDTDTLAAIVGALCGLEVGLSGLPADWLSHYGDWPHSRDRLVALANALAAPEELPAYGLRHFHAGLYLRSPLFLLVVLTHGLRRLLPPW